MTLKDTKCYKQTYNADFLKGAKGATMEYNKKQWLGKQANNDITFFYNVMHAKMILTRSANMSFSTKKTHLQGFLVWVQNLLHWAQNLLKNLVKSSALPSWQVGSTVFNNKQSRLCTNIVMNIEIYMQEAIRISYTLVWNT